MTDVNNSALVREILLITDPAARLDGIVREVLLATQTAAQTAGIVREVLLVDAVAGVTKQYAVTVIS